MFASVHVLYICALSVNIIDRFFSSLVQTVLSVKAWTNSLAKTIQLIDRPPFVRKKVSPNIVVLGNRGLLFKKSSIPFSMFNLFF